MPPMTRPVSRRALLGGLGGLALLGPLAACATSYPDLRLTVATGNRSGTYFLLGGALATAWRDALDMRTPPAVTPTDGSIDNLQLLADRRADVVFNQIDTAADWYAHTAHTDPQAIRSLARIYDDVLHIVVPAASSVTTVAQLRGKRVALGSPGSGVEFLARLMLQALGISPDRDLTVFPLGLDDSPAALRDGRIDAFFWSGGLPVRGIADLAASMPLRLLSLQDTLHDDLRAIHRAYPEYASGTIPAGTYGLSQPVITLLLHNVLLVRAEMPDAVAYALVAALFAKQDQIATASPNALTIDMRAAIGTEPVPLHPGAERWFRDARNA